MKNCPTCNKRNWDDAEVCHNCGGSIKGKEDKYPEYLYAFHKKLKDENSDSLAKIMLIESGNLGCEIALRDLKKEGLEPRKLVRYERKLVKSLKKEIYDYCGADWKEKPLKKRKPPKPSKPKESSEFLNALGNFAEDIFEWAFRGPIHIMLFTFMLMIPFYFIADLFPERELTREEKIEKLHAQLRSARNMRDHSLKKTHQYMDRDNAGMAWEWNKDAQNYQSKVESIGNQIRKLENEQSEAIHESHTREEHQNHSESERKDLANRKAQQKTFEERKAENVREAQRRLGLLIDSIKEELGYNLDKSDNETIEEDYLNAISLLDNREKSIKQKISAIEAAREAHTLYVNHKRAHPNLDEDEKRIGDEIFNLNEDKASIYAKSLDLFHKLKELDKDFYSLKDFDAENSLGILKTKNRGMPSESFSVFSFYVDKGHVISGLFEKGLIYMPNITPKIKRDDGLQSELFTFLLSEPEKQVKQLQRKIFNLKRTQSLYNLYRADLEKLETEYDRMHSIYPLDRAQLEEFPGLKSDLSDELAKVEEWKEALNQSNDLVNLFLIWPEKSGHGILLTRGSKHEEKTLHCRV